LPELNYDQARDGLLLICLGLFKKIVIADSLQEWIGPAYQNAHSQSGWSLYLATLLARYQLFADLSGYTDIALGSAAIFGVRLMQNFNRPFAAVSITDHWNRWHISLSSWFRDYLYYPLVTSPFGRLGLYFNIVATFLILGLWHDGTWNFAIYGLLQGAMIVLHDVTRKGRARFCDFIGLTRFPRLKRANEIFWTFGVLVALPTVFFQTRSASDSWFVLKKILWNVPTHLPTAADFSFLGSSRPHVWPFILFFVAAFEILQWINVKRPISGWLKAQKPVFRWSIYTACLVIFLVFGDFGKSYDFIYRHF
jgi:D-alanyl-lipoteichoic acid acyltransferase DltB (MBOAT superfamily)